MRGMREAQIMVVVKEPDREPYIEPLFDNTLEAFQAAVGGNIEAVTICTDIVIICNEEGRLLNLPYNCSVANVPFYGTILAVGVKGEDFASIKGKNISFVLDMLGRSEQ